jgi:peptide-methionine (S)-S-oxide reductase
MSEMETLVLGGGCFWCTESVYKEVRGVTDVESGYSNGQVRSPATRTCAPAPPAATRW